MSDDQEVVIVGADGTEHVFPPGMDPAKAAAIVRGDKSALRRFGESILPSTTVSDYWEGPAYVAKHPIDSASLVWNAIKSDPVGAIPVVGQLKRAGEKTMAGNYAGAAGEVTAAAAPLMLRGVRVPVGKGTAAVGRAMEAVGESRPAQYASGAGAVAEAMRGDPLKAIASVATPPALRMSGKGLQLLGRVMQGTEDVSPIDRYAPSLSGYEPGAAPAEPAMSFAPEVAEPMSATTKPHFTVTDVQRIKDLVRQGVSERAAVDVVQSMKQHPRPVNPDEYFNRR